MMDEARALRVRLEAGDWRALLDPLVPLVLLSDPGEWWPDAVEAVLQGIQRQGESRLPGWVRSLPEAAAWNQAWQRQTRLGEALVDPVTGRGLVLEANVAWARAVVRGARERGHDVEAVGRALDVLEAWLWRPTSSR